MKLIQCIPTEDKIEETIKHIYAISNAGFDGVFLQWYDNDINKINHQIKICKLLNLYIDFVHLNYENINYLWQNNKITKEIIDAYIDKLYICKEHNIGMVILHLSSKEKAPPLSYDALLNFKKVIKKAENLNIKIALENTKTIGRFEFLYNNINSKNIGLCLDSGHLHCFYKDNINWTFLKNKLFTLHLHDNLQLKDDHLLPFDGNLNWQKLIKNINQLNYKGNLVLETHHNKYKNLQLNEFYKNCMHGAQKTHELFKTTTY